MESLFEFVLNAREHLLVGTHPHQSVDGDAFLTTREWSIKEDVASLEIEQCRLQSEEDGGIGT